MKGPCASFAAIGGGVTQYSMEGDNGGGSSAFPPVSFQTIPLQDLRMHDLGAPLPLSRQRAHSLRKDMTEPERLLWWGIKTRLAMPEAHFRKQCAIGPYIADFCSHRLRLWLYDLEVLKLSGNNAIE
jgi:hypothetical protein